MLLIPSPPQLRSSGQQKGCAKGSLLLQSPLGLLCCSSFFWTLRLLERSTFFHRKFPLHQFLTLSPPIYAGCFESVNQTTPKPRLSPAAPSRGMGSARASPSPQSQRLPGWGSCGGRTLSGPAQPFHWLRPLGKLFLRWNPRGQAPSSNLCLLHILAV